MHTCITHMHAHTAYVHTHTYTHTRTYTYIHTCIHTYMHTYLHTYIHTERRKEGTKERTKVLSTYVSYCFCTHTYLLATCQFTCFAAYGEVPVDKQSSLADAPVGCADRKTVYQSTEREREATKTLVLAAVGCKGDTAASWYRARNQERQRDSSLCKGPADSRLCSVRLSPALVADIIHAKL